MRLRKTMLNVSSNVFIMAMRTIMLFVVRIVFIRTLGKVYLGVDSLFTNLLSVLSIVDLGITSAINYSLYKPLSEKDYKRVSALMSFFRKMYICMGCILTIIGFIIALFLPIIVKEKIEYIYIIYFLYLFNTVSTYFISYKESLIVADQNKYKLTNINFIFYILLYILRIVALFLTKNFIIYIMILVIITLIQRIFINIYISKKYNFIDFKSKKEIPKNEKKEMVKRIKAMFMHKIGSYVIFGTDSVVISAVDNLGIVFVGLYTNYLSIINTTTSLFEQVYKGITSSFGDLAVNESEKTQENVFNIVNFVGFLMYGLASIGFYFLLTPFIKICFGELFELNNAILIIMIINFYIAGMIASIDMIKEATGQYVIDKYVPIIQAIINLIISVILARYIGLIGVVIGTLLSYIFVSLWNRPYIIYKYIFKSSIKYYIVQQLKYILTIILTIIALSLLFRFIIIGNIYISFVIKSILCISFFAIFVVCIFNKTEEFKFLKNSLNKIVTRKKVKND